MLGNSFHLISAVIAEMDETVLEEKLAFKIYASLQSQIAAFFYCPGWPKLLLEN